MIPGFKRQNLFILKSVSLLILYHPGYSTFIFGRTIEKGMRFEIRYDLLLYGNGASNRSSPYGYDEVLRCSIWILVWDS